MKRIIKFRAWVSTDFDDNGEPVHKMIYDLAFEDYEPINDLLNGMENLMQYTGITDREGKEIYEGDLLVDDFGLRLRVVFYEGSFSAVPHPKGYPILLRDIRDRLTVVGNVFETAVVPDESSS